MITTIGTRDVILFKEGQPAKEIFVLVEGKVEESFSAGEAVLTPIHPVSVGEIIGWQLYKPYEHWERRTSTI